MSEAMTIFCKTTDFTAMKTIVSSRAGWIVESDLEAQVLAKNSYGQMKITAIFPEVGGRFGQVYMGAINRVKRIPYTGQFDLNSLQKDLKETNMIVGIVVEPQFGDSSDDRFQAVFDLASAGNGVVFDGFTFLDSSGKMITTLEGQTST